MDRWKDILGYEGKYQISDSGEVKRLSYTYKDTWGCGRVRVMPERLVCATIGKGGYKMVDLHFCGVRKRMYVHRLVAQAFIPNPNNLPQVNHKDENKLNNCVSNLEWCTHAYNQRYGTKNERMVQTRRLNGTYTHKTVCRLGD